MILLAPTALSAQTPPACGPTARINEILHDHHGERLYDSFLFGNAVYQLWLSPRHHTGSIVRRSATGTSCVVLTMNNVPNKVIDRVDIIPIADAHPPAGSFDPYKGYTTPGGGSCCDDRDCAPAPYDPNTGLMQMPNGKWFDPLAEPGIAIYFSFDGRGHLCYRAGPRCAFIPGTGA